VEDVDRAWRSTLFGEVREIGCWTFRFSWQRSVRWQIMLRRRLMTSIANLHLASELENLQSECRDLLLRWQLQKTGSCPGPRMHLPALHRDLRTVACNFAGRHMIPTTIAWGFCTAAGSRRACARPFAIRFTCDRQYDQRYGDRDPAAHGIDGL
jgi:hypothetical protein